MLQELYEMRILVVVDNGAEADALLDKIGEVLAEELGPERYGAVLYEGINPNGTATPEGFRAVESNGSDAALGAMGAIEETEGAALTGPAALVAAIWEDAVNDAEDEAAEDDYVAGEANPEAWPV